MWIFGKRPERTRGITCHLLSDVGERNNNEDSVGQVKVGSEYCFVLADGLGGHGKGEIASGLAVDHALSTFKKNGKYDENSVAASLQSAQDAVIAGQLADISCRDMKTTCVVLQISDEILQWGHVGDSRLYYFHKGRIVKRTKDHSVPQMLVDSGEIKEKEIRRHPDRNRLLRVMGIEWEEPKFHLEAPVRRSDRQAFLLCSDGFWELIDEKKMEQCLKKAQSASEWAELMKAIVAENGKGSNMDNYSAITVWVD